MKTALHIGNTAADPENVSYVTGAIVEIFEAAFRTHQSEAVVLAAMEALGKVANVSATVSHCNFTS